MSRGSSGFSAASGCCGDAGEGGGGMCGGGDGGAGGTTGGCSWGGRGVSGSGAAASGGGVFSSSMPLFSSATTSAGVESSSSSLGKLGLRRSLKYTAAPIVPKPANTPTPPNITGRLLFFLTVATGVSAPSSAAGSSGTV